MAIKPKQTTFRLYIFGQLTVQPGLRIITLFGEYKDSRAIARVQLIPEVAEALTINIRKLRAYIESGSPPFEEALLKQ
jgi:hypothetical protein